MHCFCRLKLDFSGLKIDIVVLILVNNGTINLGGKGLILDKYDVTVFR